MTTTDETTIRVSEDADVILAGRQTKERLTDLEFDASTVEEVVLVVHELASNIVKYAGEGTITLVPRSIDDQPSIEIQAHDSGPGIADIDQAIVDGYSTAGSLGGGLGTVHRLMDDVDISSDSESADGVEIVATRRSTSPTTDRQNPPLAVGAATRAKPGYDQNGDAFLIEHGRDQTLVGVIDGLGHGEAAHQASTEAKQYVLDQTTQPLADLFAGVERVCRSTRGVVMLLARFDWTTSEVTLGSIGNITVRMCQSPNPRHLVTRRGVVGGNTPDPVITEWDWDPESIMVVHSDGLASSWQCGEFSCWDDEEVTATANKLLRRLSTQDDDATVLVARRTER